jgi:NTP pyrophosphatase (non-canonical NTP hydrolase)
MYGRVHAALSEKIPKPDLIVYLQAEHDVVMRRIALRDRPYERNMDPEYIRRLAAAYEAWLANLPDIDVLTLDVSELDFLANTADLDYAAGRIRGMLEAQPPQTKPSASGQDLLGQGRLAGYQQFHQYLDDSKGFDPDLFFNYILLTEEVGEVARSMVRIWSEARVLAAGGRQQADAHEEALAKYRGELRGELADLLAYTLKMANYAGIELEQAYQEKMRASIAREWPAARS